MDGHNNGKIGDDVIKFDPNGKVLMTLGTPGVAGNDKTHFHEPSSVLVAPDGSIFVGDGHSQDTGNARIVKFDANGKYVTEWGGHGRADGKMDIPHCLAMDSKGRLFLVVLEEDASVDLRRIHEIIGAQGKVSFGSAELLTQV